MVMMIRVNVDDDSHIKNLKDIVNSIRITKIMIMI